MRKYLHYFILLILASIIFGCSSSGLHSLGYGNALIGMRIDMAIKSSGERIIPMIALTEEDAKCYYSYINGKENGLKFTIKGYHIVRIDNVDSKVEFEDAIKIGSSENILLEKYGDRLFGKRYPGKNQSWKLFSIQTDSTKVVFETYKGIIKKIRVGKTPEVDYYEGCVPN